MPQLSETERGHLDSLFDHVQASLQQAYFLRKTGDETEFQRGPDIHGRLEGTVLRLEIAQDEIGVFGANPQLLDTLCQRVADAVDQTPGLKNASAPVLGEHPFGTQDQHTILLRIQLDPNQDVALKAATRVSPPASAARAAPAPLAPLFNDGPNARPYPTTVRDYLEQAAGGRYLVTDPGEHGFQGAMAWVYPAWDRTKAGPEAPIVVKVLKPDLEDLDIPLDQRLQGARLLSTIHSPHIVDVREVGVLSDAPKTGYVIMEMLEGPELEKLQPPLEPALALRYALAVAAGLEDMHAGGVIFRDIKPANLMFAQAVSKGTDPDPKDLRIVDPGNAVRAQDARQKALGDLAQVGTPEFAAPEQFSGAVQDTYTDVYSLGALLVWMLTGLDQVEAATARKGNQSLPLSSLDASQKQLELDAILRRVFANDGKQRPSLAALTEALELALERVGS